MRPAAFCLSAVAFTVALGIAVPLQAQTPPNEPDDFSAEFLGGADQETLLPLFEGNAPDHARLNLERGNLFMDFTSHRLRVDFMDLDGTAQKTYQIYFDKQREYILDFAQKACQVITLSPETTLQPIFGWLPNATLAHSKQVVLPDNPSSGTTVVTLDTWENRPPHDSRFKEMGLTAVEGAGNTPISAFWRVDHPGFPIEVDFEAFTSGAPDATVFNVPDYCNN